jgi:hypothetical protein
MSTQDRLAAPFSELVWLGDASCWTQVSSPAQKGIMSFALSDSDLTQATENKHVARQAARTEGTCTTAESVGVSRTRLSRYFTICLTDI